jgi:hypothetical protein
MRDIEDTMLELLRERGTATACPSEVARKLATNWRPLMPRVREVAAALQRRGLVDAYQHGRPVKVANARGPIRLRTREVDIDYRKHPERYVVGRGEQGVLTVEPYKSELLPLWRFATAELAKKTARALYAKFVAYGRAGDFVGMDMARKFLQMGWTRSRRYVNRGHPDKLTSADIFFAYYTKARMNRTYAKLRACVSTTSSSGPKTPSARSSSSSKRLASRRSASKSSRQRR